MRALSWVVVVCVLLLAPSLAQADSPTAYPTRVVEYQLGQVKKTAGDPVGLVNGEVAAVKQFAQSLDPGPILAGAQKQANDTANAAIATVLGAAGPIGKDALALEQSAQQKALDAANGAPGTVAAERDYVNRVLKRFM